MSFPPKKAGQGGSGFDPSAIPPIVRDTTLDGFSTHTDKILPSDTVLGALGKAQGQINQIIDSKGQAGGIATLDESGKVKESQLPGGLYRFQGFWNPETNTPAISNSDAGLSGGEFYVCTAGGSYDFGDGSIEFHAEDVVMFSGGDGKWIKHSHHTSKIENVNGKPGPVVSLNGEDIQVSESDHRSIADAIQANHSRVFSITTLSSVGKEAYLDFGGVRWGYHYLTVNTGKQFYRASEGSIHVDSFMQKSHYDAAIEPRHTDSINLTETPIYYDPLNWSEGRERTEALFLIGSELWDAQMIIFGRTIQKVIIWAERVA